MNVVSVKNFMYFDLLLSKKAPGYFSGFHPLCILLMLAVEGAANQSDADGDKSGDHCLYNA